MILEKYLKFLNEQTGWLNFQEDRYLIMNKWKGGMISCLKKFPAKDIQGRIKLYQCQIGVCQNALQTISQAREKCDKTEFPDKCNALYDRMTGSLETKVKWNENQIPNLQRKGGLIKY